MKRNRTSYGKAFARACQPDHTLQNDTLLLRNSIEMLSLRNAVPRPSPNSNYVLSVLPLFLIGKHAVQKHGGTFGNQTQITAKDRLLIITRSYQFTLLGIEPRQYTGHEPAALPTEL